MNALGNMFAEALPNAFGGNHGVLNDVVPSAKGRIVVLADARQLFERGALRALVADFADRRVGAVSPSSSASTALGKIFGRL